MSMSRPFSVLASECYVLGASFFEQLLDFAVKFVVLIGDIRIISLFLVILILLFVITDPVRIALYVEKLCYTI
ncbi:hypothetical protein ABVK25_009174 [Lepraria finkii]|uniref:Uncharacterized protein n=1 Tax=Lepraria finkii TaxID=1340010 RepID=A0ABR4AYX3_9LECA